MEIYGKVGITKVYEEAWQTRPALVGAAKVPPQSSRIEKRATKKRLKYKSPKRKENRGWRSNLEVYVV